MSALFHSTALLPPLPKKERRVAILSTYYNPCRYRNRFDNFVQFVNNIGEDLFVAELAFEPSHFQLTSFAPTLQVLGTRRNLLWQKERLLNLLLEHIPANYSEIAWIDCDVVFENTSWRSELMTCLDEYPLVQLFDTAVFMTADDRVNSTVPGMIRFLRANGIRDEADYLAFDNEQNASRRHLQSIEPAKYSYHSGLAWACRRDILKSIGFLDTNIAGGADMRMTLCAYGAWNLLSKHIGEGEGVLQATRLWGEVFHARVKGSIGFISGVVRHLYHGDLNDRQYHSRMAILNRNQFSPHADITINGDGLWEWSSNKSDMHREMADFFASRREDGQSSPKE
jgi:hypothetical protein